MVTLQNLNRNVIAYPRVRHKDIFNFSLNSDLADTSIHQKGLEKTQKSPLRPKKGQTIPYRCLLFGIPMSNDDLVRHFKLDNIPFIDLQIH